MQQGQSRAWECSAEASSGSGLLCAQGRGGRGLGSEAQGSMAPVLGGLKARRHRELMEQDGLRAVITQARGSAGD